jgi:signal transduction histidine kinase
MGDKKPVCSVKQSLEEKQMRQEPARQPLDLCEGRIPNHLSTARLDRSQAGEADRVSGLPNDLSHELRTSLAIITLICGNLDLLYERLEDEERRRMIQKVRKHTERLNKLVSDMLVLGKDIRSAPF